MNNSFASGLLAGLIATVLGGLLLWFFIQFLEKEPEIYWFELASYELPEKYRDAFEVDIESENYEKETKDRFNSAYQSLYLVGNKGSLPAKDVTLLFPKQPLNVLAQTDVPKEFHEEETGNLSRLVLSSVEAGEQVVVIVVGAGSREAIVSFNGSKIDQTFKSHLEKTDGKKHVSLSAIWVALGIVVFVAVFIWLTLITDREEKKKRRKEVRDELEAQGLLPSDENVKADEATN
ncbi:hypothetical protein PH7735_03953 [Shimia thalassica]|uniref:Uncharacterized protein n=1 Tax=Shimia thalassica TaxID=1715693 RepID=A0A0P1IIC3_9RHOB|nr:hypothetical protein [Shimia thalassica]CUK14709.1 hypothetical protein PH7735_03953 [Shimia thalassica]